MNINVFAYMQNGHIYFDEFQTDLEAVNRIIEESDQVGRLNQMICDMGPKDGVPLAEDIMSELWNEYMQLNIKVLQAAGCTIMWM